ncbi:PIG-L family deacetylase [Candidatus Gottesmanbacteria bacterium]|nr:PIG-L family deacetylase [Candidatus Gottesmanbacteria bacterium]
MPYRASFLLLSVLLLGITTGVYLIANADNPATDVLIIAPHPDDAVLCCAGLIQQSVTQGKTVRVVNITDGDSYREAAAALSGKPASATTPADMLRLGRIRRKEEIQALGLLGIPKKNVLFLGYPDGFLEEVYRNESNTPLTNPFTQKTRATSNKPLTKSGMTTDLTDIFASHNPRHIYITGMRDTALDHQITYRMIMDAINEMGYTGTLLTYIIHAEPSDTGIYPPTATTNLTRGELLIKNRAIRKYKTQMVPDETYLSSFARDTEVFY